jgi:DNA mismatch repair ATPase MutS
VIDELDVAISFAVLATEMNFVRPEITEESVPLIDLTYSASVKLDFSGSYNVINGRHPTVEIGLLSTGRQFTPNTINMTDSSNMHIITGPNMAGKSTLLRQTALITILAQVGCFVPADYARIGVVDKLFSRIGARDDLFRDRSTFMVEMLETADILRRATEKSLVRIRFQLKKIRMLELFDM